MTMALLGVIGVAACGGGGSGAAGVAAPASTPTATGQGQAGPSRTPGVSGLLAAIDGTTLQVQDTSAQTAVVYTATTAISATVPATRADVAVGACVVVRSAAIGGASPAASVTATTVTLNPAVSGSCTAGLGGGPGGIRPSGAPAFTRPSGAPQGVRPSGAPRAGGAPGGAVGKVTAVAANGFTVASVGFAAPGSTATPSTAPIAVSTTSTTSYSKQQKATAAALKVGSCITARGAADSSGTVTATSIAVRPATNGTCTTGFGSRNG
jgi:hypothetical protein